LDTHDHQVKNADVAPYRTSRRKAASPDPETTVRPPTRSWSEERILAAITDWTQRYGSPPTYLDWDPGRARRTGHADKAELHAAGDWPTIRVVSDTFGTLNKAIQKAGLPTRRAPRSKPNLLAPHAILDAIRIWTLRYGDPPRRTDWDPTRARQTNQAWKADRYNEGDWPSLPTIARHYGGLTAAITAAGLEPAPQYSEAPGERAQRRNRNRLALVCTLSQETTLSGQQLDTALKRVDEARQAKDAEELEDALMRLAACAFGLAHIVHGRRRTAA